MTHGFEKTTVGELRDLLVKQYSMDRDFVNSVKKGELIKILIEKQDKEIDNVVDALEEDEEEAVFKEDEGFLESQKPVFGSYKWHDYVMGEFEDDELEGVERRPNHSGLTRVAELLIGPIISREIISYTTPSNENLGTATVHVRISFYIGDNEDHPLYGKAKSVSEDGITDVNERNTESPYNLKPSATASTQAESQALRKALRLRKTISADEAVPEQMEYNESGFAPDNYISKEAINLLDHVCRRTNISVLDMINCGKNKYKYIEVVPESVAKSMMKYINDIQSGNKTVPENVGKYEVNWREINDASRDAS